MDQMHKSDQIVIIGAGQGGLQAAASLRQEGYEGRIVLIGEEIAAPYQRPPLSKAYLKTGDASRLALRPDSFYETNGIELHLGLRVEAIDRAAQRVRAGSQDIPYDHLILATGTRTMRAPIPGLTGARDLRTLSDALALRKALPKAERVGVIGGGFIGLEFAAVARELGYEVTVAEAGPRLMGRAVSPVMSDRFAAKHREMGVEVLLADPVSAGTESGFALASGREVAADFILLAAGVVPNAELASEAGLPVQNGIVVDSRLVTADPAISALGDCASFPDPNSDQHVRLESVQAATDHARLIAKRIAKGDDSPYRAVPWFWSDQADWKLQIAGLAAPTDACEALPDGTVLRLDGDHVTAVETVNAAKTHMKARKLMGQGERLRREDFLPLATQ